MQVRLFFLAAVEQRRGNTQQVNATHWQLIAYSIRPRIIGEPKESN